MAKATAKKMGEGFVLRRGDLVAKVEKYKGRLTFAIHDQDWIDKEKDFTIVVAFGQPKAKAIAAFTDVIEQFAEMEQLKAKGKDEDKE